MRDGFREDDKYPNMVAGFLFLIMHHYAFLFYALVFMCYGTTIIVILVKELLQPYTSRIVGIPPHVYVTN